MSYTAFRHLCFISSCDYLIENDIISGIKFFQHLVDRIDIILKIRIQCNHHIAMFFRIHQPRKHRILVPPVTGKGQSAADHIFPMKFADLQDDINAIDEMLEKFKAGNDVVYGVRSSRKKDTFFKKTTAEGFYHMMKWMGVDIVFNHADYRLMSKRVLEELGNYKEVHLFLRGMIPLIGFPSDNVYYERKERMAGESKYPLKKMLAFAFDGISSFSVKPIRFIVWLGFVIFIVSIGMLIYSIVEHMLGDTVRGWSSLIVSIWALGGLQLLAIGVIGEYIGKVYMETKGRPRYAVEEVLDE